MRILAMEFAGLRNLQSQRLTLGHRGNSFVGPNGAGKTSFLESIYLLSTGRSFRASSFEAAITYGEPRSVVSALIESVEGERRIGVERSRNGSVHARMDGVDLVNASSLAQQLPCHLLDASTIGVVIGSPKARRQLLDWGVFHVEHDYVALTRAFRVALMQRNAVLQSGDDNQLKFWDRRFVELASRVNVHRQRYVDLLAPGFQTMLTKLDAPSVDIAYRAGWKVDVPLAEVLAASRESERNLGRTAYGPHRADLRLTSAGRLLPQSLSRGQQKVVAYALVLAQIRLELAATPHAPIVLVDDLLAELDVAHASRVNDALLELGVQYFVTSIEPNSGATSPGDDLFLKFHVEQGMITPINL